MLCVQKKQNPIDYSLCNQTITLYHQNSSTKEISRIVIENVSLDFRKNHNVNKTGSSEVNSFLLVIPETSCQYIIPEAFQADTNTYTLQNLDKVQLGIGPELRTAQDWAVHIPSKVQGLVVVKYIDPKYWNAKLCHVEAGG